MVFLVVLIVGLPLASVGTAVPRIADGRWNDVERETWTRMCALQRASPRRPVLRGEPLPGNAWKDYEKVGTLKFGESFYAIENFVSGKSERSREEILALMEPYLPLLNWVQAGTHRTEVLRIAPWNDSLPYGFSGWYATALGVCRARFLVEEGDIAGAVELLLDLMQYLGDLGRLGRGFSLSSAVHQRDRVVTELNAMMAVGLLNRDDLRRVVREMAVLEKSVPPFGTMMRDAAMFSALRVLRTQTVEKYLAELAIHDTKVPTWQFGFSQKLLMSRYADLEYRVAEGIAQGDGKPWAEARERTVRICDEATAARHPLYVWTWNPGGRVDWLGFQQAYLLCVAHFRLTRAAAEYLAEGKVPELDDPFGDKLLSAKAGLVMRIWSVGWDGIDQGGVGGWSGKNSPDIVLEVRR
jgi:hypothetical protein